MITYSSDESGVISCINVSPEESVSRGVSFKENGTYYTVATLKDLLKHLLHRHAPFLQCTLDNSYTKTIAHMYKEDAESLFNIIENRGGVDYFQTIINELEKLYEILYHQNNQENELYQTCGD